MRPSLAALLVTVAALLACTGGDTTITTPSAPAPLNGSGTADNPHAADCWTTAQQLGKSAGQSDHVACPAGCTSGMIWGTGRYTPDSKVCVAAVHAGVLENAGSGTVLVRLEGSYGNFVGSEANGVKSESWSPTYELSFSVAEPPGGRGGKAGKGGKADDGDKGEKGGKGGKNR
jgi:hypothetical protein